MSALTREVVGALLKELAIRIAGTGAHATIRVVGGAAIALLDPTRRATADIDAVVVPGTDIDGFVADMATERDLPLDWFNSAVRMWIPFVGEEDWVEILRVGDVTISLGSTTMLLAMKLRASRARDHDDIAFLLHACHVRTIDDAQQIYERYQHQEVLSPAAEARVQHWLDHRSGRPSR